MMLMGINLKQSKLFIFLASIVLILFSILVAQESALVQVLNWKEKANLLGSPRGYYYISQYGKVEVYSSTGSKVLTKKLRGEEKTYASALGQYWGTANLVELSATTLKVTKFSLYNPSGNLIYAINDPGALGFVLNDKSSNFVGVEGTEGLPLTSLRFFNAEGKLTKAQEITSYSGGRFSTGGNLFYALSADSGLFVFQPDGTLSFRINACRQYAASDDGRLLLIFSGSRLELYSFSEKIYSVEITGVNLRKILLSNDKKTALLMYDDHAVRYTIPELKAEWEYRPQDPRGRFNSCDYNQDKKLYAFGIAIDNGTEYSFRDRYTDGMVDLVDTSGTKIGFASLSYASWSRGFPKVEFSDADNILWVITHLELYRLSLNN